MILNPDQAETIFEALAEARGAFESGQLTHARDSLDFIKRILDAAQQNRAPWDPETTNPERNLAELVSFLSARYDVPKETILAAGKGRGSINLARLRWFGYRLAREFFTPKQSVIARGFNKDHNSVFWGLRALQNALDTEAPLRLEFETLRRDFMTHFQLTEPRKEAA